MSLNYRLGPFGYLHGNAWLTDQRLAPDWIVANIAAFGGDPERITLGGQSGGAYSTVALLGLPDPPPIRRAVLLSAPLGIPARTAEESAAFTDEYAAAVGVPDLRAASLAQLLAVLPGAGTALGWLSGAALGVSIWLMRSGSRCVPTARRRPNPAIVRG